jgi:CheY-like chemotaxis protein
LEGRETILVVENDDEVRKLVLQALTSFGYRILPAKSGDEALAIVKKHTASIDLMLTDVLMPKMNGKQLADNVHSVLPNLGVLFMSGHTGEVTLGRGLLDPGTPCLHKPFTPEALGQHVRDALGETGLPRRILVVDDDAAIRTLFAAVLQEEGYEVVLAGDGAEAAKAFAGSSFNLVITDLSIPHPEEIEPIRGIRQRQPGLKVIVVSGAYGSEALTKAVGMLDADAYFQKPVGPGQLLTAVRELLY